MTLDKIAKTENIISKEYSNIAGMVVMKSIISILYGIALDKGFLTAAYGTETVSYQKNGLLEVHWNRADGNDMACHMAV